jgi:hypothetical protein
MQTLSHQNPRYIHLPVFAAILATALAASLGFGQSSVGGNTTPLPPAAGSVSQTRNIPLARPNETVSGDYPGQGSGGVAVVRSQSDVNVSTTSGSNNRPQIGISRALRYAEEVKPPDVLYLCLSIASCAVAFFMLYQSIALQKMLTHGRENAPDPDAGAGVAWLLFWLTCGVCSFY